MGIINSRISSSQHITHKKTWLSSDTQVLALPATAGLVLAHGPPPWPSTGTDPSCAATESTLSTAFARRRGPLRLTLRPMPTTAMADTVLATEATAMEVSDTDTARGLLKLSPRPMPGTADTDLVSGASPLPALTLPTSQFPVPAPLVSGSVRLTLRLMPTTAMVDTVLVMEATAMAALATATARGLLTLRLMPTTAMVDTALAMEATAMAVLATAMARGLLTLRLMPTMAMADTALAMEATDTAVLATATARGLLMPTTATVDTVLAMEATATAVSATAMASKSSLKTQD